MLKKIVLSVVLVLMFVFTTSSTSFAQLRTKKSVDSTFIEGQSISLEHLRREVVTEIIPLVSISFDDGYRSVIDSVFPEYLDIDSPYRVYGKSKGRSDFVATAFVVGSKQDATVGSGCKMGKEDWITLRNAGWEIGAHSWDHGQNHTWYGSLDSVRTAAYDSLEWEVEECYKLFVDTLGWNDVVSYAYPYGRVTPVYKQIVGKYFKYGIGYNLKSSNNNATQLYQVASTSGGRGITQGAIGYGAVFDPLDVPRMSTTTPTWATFRQDILDAVDAWSVGIIVILHSPVDHGLCDGDPTDALFQSGGETLGDMVAFFDTLEADRQIDIVTVKELMARTYSRPISPSANWVDWKMKDADGNGYPNCISGVTNDRQLSPNHIIGDYPIAISGQSEVTSDTVGVNGGDIWGLTKMSAGIGYIFKPLAISALEPGDILEFGVHAAIMDTTCGDDSDCSSDGTIFSIDNLGLFLQGRWMTLHGVEDDSTRTWRNQDVGWSSQKELMQDRDYILQPRGGSTVTNWAYIYERVRIGLAQPDSISMARVLAANGDATSVDLANFECFGITFSISHTATCTDDSLFNRIAISHPWVNIKKSNRSPTW